MTADGGAHGVAVEGCSPVSRRRWAGFARRARHFAAAGVLALLPLACGEATFSSSPEAREHARAAVDTWLGACANEDSEAVVEILTPPTREIIFSAPSVLEGCEQVADLTPEAEPESERLKELFERAEVEHVTVDGGYGTALLRAPEERPSEIELELDMGRWAVTNPPLASS
jgi:hypothetical protein